MTGARRSSAQTSRLNSVMSRIGEVATTEAVREPPIATSGGADQSGGEISTAISPTTSPAPTVPTVSPLMTTSAVPLSMAYSEYPTRPSSASNCPGGISSSDAMLATAASSFSGKSAKKRIAASRNVSIFPDYTAGPTYATANPGRSPGRRHLRWVLGLLVDARVLRALFLLPGAVEVRTTRSTAAPNRYEITAPHGSPVGPW